MDDRPSTSGAAGAVSETPKSSGASAADQAERKQRQKVKKQVCTEVTRRLESLGHPYTLTPNYAEDLLAHFNRLPTRYALDVNTERAEDVLNHKRLLEEAKRAGPHGVPVFFVRPVRLAPAAPHAVSAMETDGPLQSMAAPPAFGSTQNLQEEMGGGADVGGMEEDVDSASMQRRNSNFSSNYNSVPMHEVTFSTVDRPKLLSQLSAVLADVGLNIREAHVFSTSDGLSLDVFVVDGWPHEEVMELHSALLNAIQTAAITQGAFVFAHDPSAAAIDAAATSMSEGVQPGTPMAMHAMSSGGGSGQLVAAPGQAMDAVRIPSDGRDDWEIDSSQLKLSHKIASGSFGDLFRGTYCGQDVAIKILKPERLNDTLQQEFAQEVFIMRKVRHKNVVQFIGACTKPPNLSIVTEFMAGGSVYDYLHKHKGSMKPPMLLRVALDVAKGMDFLHKNHIIHRDLKAANLLLDENEVVKVADFGVARVKADSGIMTAETGTYRWMAPEVIEHRAYDHKADVFSFSITLWELLTGKIPYSDLTPLQAAVSVVQKGLRPPIPKGTHPKLVELMDKCWHTDPAQRPEFAQIIPMLTEIAQEVEEDSGSGKGGDSRRRERRGGFFSALKR